MNELLEEVCGYLHNYFIHEIHTGDFSIVNGSLDVDFLQNGQYFRIVGSVFNDCVCQYPAADLHDEEFSGSVWAMAVPPSLIALLLEIEAWIAKYDGDDSTLNSPYTSESFNNYSYSKASGTNSDGSYAPVTWQSIFAKRLDRWRKLP
jgi:hypothetical protein